MDTTENFSSNAEVEADAATKFEPFGINLPEVRRTTSLMLNQIGRNGIFDQYTRHDISHIDELLHLTDWIIDPETKKVMTPGDWLMIVLSIYFHDLGMLVTENEFKAREKSVFPTFREEILDPQFSGKDYVARIKSLPPDEQDRFLYQEFVRKTHAIRVRRWIEGKEDAELGYSVPQAREIQRVLSGLDSSFRRDLGLIAESHHLDDLYDLKKYNPAKAYGSRPEEVVNLQYVAIVLRSADLLHMRRDRTPSVLFRLINPNNPISQREWAKQNAIKKVAPQIGKNKEGIPDETAPKDTIEVHAHFDNEEGFFGLTSFLGYVQSELTKSVKWNTEARKLTGTKHRFIWKEIVDDAVETEGFLRKQFAFTLDKGKILDLLVGHTLYNDTSVVLRELIQNSVDAIRLQALQKPGSPIGEIKVVWNSTDRTLSVTDNGTGMDQSVIEDHLLKVGSSRYQDDKFKKDNPTFSPISRFGIGVLSTFMISDEIDITTVSPTEAEARRISLRGVNGRYLIRLLDKSSEEVRGMGPHGTKFCLRLRHAALLQDVVALVRRWILIPACRVTVQVDDAAPVSIGFGSPAEALEDYLAGKNFQEKTADGKPALKIVEKKVGGLSIAYAVRWSEHFKDWTMISADGRTPEKYTIPCTCIEGITVDAGSPGFRTHNILAVANATGKGAPKTNVARSGLERTPEFDETVKALYDIYLQHVRDEMARLRTSEGYSLTWAVANAISLASPIVYQTATAMLPGALEEKIRELPIFLVEENGKRRNAAFSELVKAGAFWTSDSALMRSTEHLVRETSGNSSISAVIDALGDPTARLPDGLYLSNLGTPTISAIVEDHCEPTAFLLQRANRRIDIKWEPKGDASRWLRMRDFYARNERNPNPRTHRLMQLIDAALNEHRRSYYQYPLKGMWIPVGNVEAIGAEAYAGLGIESRVFLCPNTELAKFLVEKSKAADSEDGEREFLALAGGALGAVLGEGRLESQARLTNVLKRLSFDAGLDYGKLHSQLQSVFEITPHQFFDSYVWSARSPEH